VTPFTFTWSYNGVQLAGETSSSLTLQPGDVTSTSLPLQLCLKHPTPLVHNETFATTSTWYVRSDTGAPEIVSIVRQDANPTSSSLVHFLVTFTEGVSGVGPSDFALSVSGLTGASVQSTTALGPMAVWTVAVDTGSGDGAIKLNLVDDGTIVNGAGAALGGIGQQHYDAGEEYSIDRTPPSATIIEVSPDPRDTPVDEAIIWFSEPMQGLEVSQLALRRDGGANLLTGMETLVDDARTTWTLDLSALTGADGVYQLTLLPGTVSDLAGNALAAGAIENWTMDTPEIELTSVRILWHLFK
jgi:hypothetical protein